MDDFNDQQYCGLVTNSIARLYEENNDDCNNCSAADKNDGSNYDDDNLYTIIKRKDEKISHSNNLKAVISETELERLKRKIISLLNKESKDLSSLRTKLSYLNSNLKNVTFYSSGAEQALIVERNLQKEFVETVEMIASFCNSSDEDLKFLDNDIDVDWEALLDKMGKTAAAKRVELSQMSRLTERLKGIITSVDSILENANQSSNQIDDSIID